jgi:ferrous iron transport protein B
MSCTAKLPVYVFLTAAFFPRNRGLIIVSLYVIGILVAIISGLLLKRTVYKGSSVPFIMELPAYRFPSGKTLLLHMWEKAKDFITRAFTVIFIATIIIWLLQSFDFRFNLVEDSAESMLAAIGTFIAPIFAPLGFGNWRASTALITGLTAKEAVVSTFEVLLGNSMTIQELFTPLSAFAFLCFILLYMPCVAAFAAAKRELGSLKGAVLTAAFQTGVAWLVAFLVYNVGRLFIGG